MKKENNIPNDTSEVKILDLDQLDDTTAMDYEKMVQEDSMTLKSTNNTPEYNQPKKSNGPLDVILRVNWHLVLLFVLIFSVVFVIYRFKTWGIKVDLDNLGIVDDTNYDVEVVDNILPLVYEGNAPALHDGVRKVVLFGNDTFAQNRGTSDDMANMIAELTGATVYNCAVTGSFLASTNNFIHPETAPMDAFNLYWLTTVFTGKIDTMEPYDRIFNQFSDQISSDAREAFETLCSIDFSTIDEIGIMYDAHDYLAGKPLVNQENPTDVYCFTGNLEASIDLIQETYPHIRIIVMSPTYAYGINKDGDYVSSDIYYYIEDGKLSKYALYEEFSASNQGVTFVDNIYGTINENNADQYLLDNINLNIEGRKKLAKRFVYALEYYDEKE